MGPGRPQVSSTCPALAPPQVGEWALVLAHCVLAVDGFQREAHLARLDILTLLLVVWAALRVGGDHCDVSPWSRHPVWEVVSLLGAFETTAIAIGVLPSASGIIANILVGREEAWRAEVRADRQDKGRG